MANSKYEYVRSIEKYNKFIPSTWIVVRIEILDFHRFSEEHEFDKPNDERALNLMNACALAMLKEFPDIVFSYGIIDEYSFIFKKTTQFYERRVSKIGSIILSYFSSAYGMKWGNFFPDKELRTVPSFVVRTILYPSNKLIRDFLAWRHVDCHINNQYNTFWMLVKSRKTKQDAQDELKSTQAEEKNELLFKQNVNYSMLPAMFRKGSCVFREKRCHTALSVETSLVCGAEVEEIVKYKEDGEPVKRLRDKLIIDQCDIKMANCEYESFEMEYVKPFEIEHNSTWIVVRIDGRHFHKFSKEHEFDKPNDARALNLMNACAVATLEKFPGIVFSYGASDEYSFVCEKTSQFYNSKIEYVIVSFFSFVYVMKWREFFPEKELRSIPCFDGRTISYPSTEIIRDYLAWRQVDCHINNQYNTCFWMLVKSGKTEQEGQRRLKGTQAEEKNELLFKEFDINYNTLPAMFRKGSCVFRDKVEEIVNYNEGAEPIKRFREKVSIDHCDIIGDEFWKQYPSILKEQESSAVRNSIQCGSEVNNPLGRKRNRMGPSANGKYEYLNLFEMEQKLMPSTSIVVRIDGCHFHQFSEEHEFDKPNDERALNLMNACAEAMLEEFPDIVFSYGASDEYSFVFKRKSQFYQRRVSKIGSAPVSFFQSTYAKRWREFFPEKELRHIPSFDEYTFCFPSTKMVRDYLAWRQEDCHINNQYNTCLWMLVKSGKTKQEAEDELKGTREKDKNELLFKEFNINYNKLPAMFRKGSCGFRAKVEVIVKYNEGGEPVKRFREKVIIDHCDITGEKFWKQHPGILKGQESSSSSWLRQCTNAVLT